jgi:transposase-like protein
MPKKKARKALPRADRMKIIAEAKAKGLTATQVEKKYGVNKWTYYGWMKRTGKPKVSRARGSISAKGAGAGADVLRREIRAVLPGILRDELARAFAGLIGAKKTGRRGR